MTPERALTSTESNHRTNMLNFIPLDDPFENRVFEFIGHFTANDVSQLHQKNGIFDARLRAYRPHCRRYSDMITKFYPRITGTPHLGMSDIRSIVDLQLRSEFDVIAIPEPVLNGDVEEFEKNFERFSTYISDRKRVPMPYVDMANDNNIFKNKLRKILDHQANIRCLGLMFRSPNRFYPNFISVSEMLGNSEIWIHASNVPRMLSQTIPLAQAHFPQAHCIDTVGLESRQVNAPLRIKPLEKIRKFVEKTLGETRLADIADKKEPDSDCQCGVCQQLASKDLSKTTDLQKIDICCKVHETFDSTREFGNSRESIKQDDMKSYIKSKKYLDLAVSQVSRGLTEFLR